MSSAASKVAADISMSLDGYVTGPGPDLEHGLGRGGEALHDWVFASHDSPGDRRFMEAAAEATGAVVMGRRTFDFVDGPHGWNGAIGYAYDQEIPASPPVFVVTHAAPGSPRHQSGFTFVTGGVADAVAAARAAAGARETVIMGGASVIGQAVAGGLVDELRIHLSPVLMGGGTRLFDHVDRRLLLAQQDAVATGRAVHLTYRPR
ncbi:dihydrofolate reductase family protein [Nocardiopsis coralliicola]